MLDTRVALVGGPCDGDVYGVEGTPEYFVAVVAVPPRLTLDDYRRSSPALTEVMDVTRHRYRRGQVTFEVLAAVLRHFGGWPYTHDCCDTKAGE